MRSVFLSYQALLGDHVGYNQTVNVKEELHRLIEGLADEHARDLLADLQDAADVNGPPLDSETRASLDRALADIAADRVVSLEEFENKDIDATNSEGLTTLHQAMQDDLYSISSVLLEHGANIEAEGPSGWRALHYAARKGNPSTVQLCLSHGADTGATTSRTCTHKMRS